MAVGQLSNLLVPAQLSASHGVQAPALLGDRQSHRIWTTAADCGVREAPMIDAPSHLKADLA